MTNTVNRNIGRYIITEHEHSEFIKYLKENDHQIYEMIKELNFNDEQERVLISNYVPLELEYNEFVNKVKKKKEKISAIEEIDSLKRSLTYLYGKIKREIDEVYVALGEIQKRMRDDG